MRPNVVVLPGQGNYAVIVPGRIVYGLGASSQDELNSLIKETVEQNRVFSGKQERPWSSLGLIPTYRCSLRCIYCYAHGGDSAETIRYDLVSGTMKQLRETEKKDWLKLSLSGGGEPLVPFELVEMIVSCAKFYFPKVEVEITTNATFRKETLLWLEKNQVSVRVSYDGVMQEKQRPFRNGRSSKRKVVENIRNLVEAGLPLAVSCVVTDEGVTTLKTTIDELVEMGVSEVEFEPARRTGLSRNKDWKEPEPIRFAQALLEAITYAASLEQNLAITTGYFSAPDEKSGYCGVSGANRILTPHGLVTSCVEVSRPTEKYAEKLIYGRINNGRMLVNAEKLNALRDFDKIMNQGGCSGCDLRMICRGGCPMAGVWEKGFPPQASSYTCELEHYFLPRLLLAMAEDPNIAAVVAGGAEIKC